MLREPVSRVAAAVLAALACAIAPAGATAAAVEATRDRAAAAGDLGTVTVTARLPQPLSEVAASVTVVDAGALEARVARDLADLARYEPGFSVRTDATRFGAGDFAIRGIGGNRVLIEVDGVPSAPGFAVGNFADAGRAYLDLDLVRRVEVLRGPASSLYGSEALGGVISLQSWNPEDLLGDRAFGARARTAWRGDDDGWLASAIGAGRAGESAFLVGYAHRDSAELESNSRTLRANPRDVRTRAWLAKLVHGAESPLRLGVDRQETEAVTDVRSLLLQPGRFANTIAMRGDDAAHSTRVVLDQQFEDAGPFTRAEWRLYWRRSAARQRTDEERRAAGPRTPAVGLLREFRFEAETVGAEATASREFEAAGLQHRLVGGFEVDRSRIEESRDGRQTTLATGAVANVILGENFPLRDFPLSTIVRGGVFLQDRLARPGSRHAWIPALRVDHYRLRPHVDALWAEDNPRTTPVDVEQTSLSPRLGYTYALREHVTLFAQYTHGFRSPPFEDVNVGLDLPLFATRAIPNPDLDPERSDGVEVGLRAERGRVRGSASAYYNRYRDFIQSRVNLGRDASGTTIFQSRNLDRARIWGVELAGTWEAGEGGTALDGFFVRAAAAYSRGDDTARDRPLNTVDPAEVVLGAGYAAPSTAWGAALMTTTVAAKRRVDDGATRLVRTPGYTTLDLDAWWRPLPALELRAAVLNATDRSYFEWQDVRSRAADDPSLELYRRPGRSVAVSATWTF